jgi:hypothetical protein
MIAAFKFPFVCNKSIADESLASAINGIIEEFMHQSSQLEEAMTRIDELEELASYGEQTKQWDEGDHALADA